MGIAKFIKRNFSSFSRNRAKKETINKVLQAKQQHEGVINIHRIDENNVGDFYCGPHLYFKELKGRQLDIFDFKHEEEHVRQNWIDKISENALIIGGGGLLNRGSFEMQMKLFEELARQGKKAVIWGAGHNEKSSSRFGKVKNYNIDLSVFQLSGTRDYGLTEFWLPCVSCMHDIFDRNFTTEQEVGIIFHKKTLKRKNLLKNLEDLPSTSNTTNLEDMIGFIGKSETVITDSYHAMYWSFLLGKKVAVIPNSSKFFSFKYNPHYTDFKNFRKDIKKAKSYSGLLEECRVQNRIFAERVFNELNL